MPRFLTIAALFTIAVPAVADDEFFEKKIRPILAEHCYKCHASTSKKIKGDLTLDSRQAALKGGETGPAIVPGSPEKSLLIEAVSYKNVDLLMPPNSKLPDHVVADLTKWIRDGASWPGSGAAVKEPSVVKFDLEQRKREHWSWKPIQPVAPPTIAGVKSPIDRFIIQKLAQNKLTPAPIAEPRVILRRLSFDIVGVPPTPEMVREFEKDFQVDRDRAIETMVDRLLASPQFGERWGRHWLDLVRYAESRGHEFDHTVPNAYQYRDYVIRALNADVPYDQFVREHLAGDLLPNPRLHPTAKFNESILGTGFWFLGEQVHSPVDICQDRAERLDNQLDVMSKAFFGLTVSCARCHDHKFDAISAKDYYALAGFLESSSYRLTPFESLEHNRDVAGQLWRLRDDYRSKQVGPSAIASLDKAIRPLDDYLEEARATLRKTASTVPPDRRSHLDPKRIAAWVDHLRAAVKNPRDPMHSYACEAHGLPTPSQPMATIASKSTVILDYESCPPDAWLPDGFAFGSGPARRGMIRLDGRSVVMESAAEYDPVWAALKSTGSDNEPGALGKALRAGRTLRTPKFDLTEGVVHVRVRGSGMIYAAVEGHVMILGPLHGALVRSIKVGPEFRWQAIDLNPYKGRRLHLEFTPDGPDFAVSKVVVGAPPADDDLTARPEVAEWNGEVKPIPPSQQAARIRSHLSAALSAINRIDPAPTPLEAHRANWLLQHARLFVDDDLDPPGAKEFQAKHDGLVKQIRFDSRLAPAILDGNPVNERVFIRGNYKTPGEVAPRRFLEALAGQDVIASRHGSGRLELANQITDPKQNPFFTRVFVNRVWHHLFGRGLVGSVDNFGVLGESPSHPELLDSLADGFAKGGYSLKALIRDMTRTDAYQRSSRPSDEAAKNDPTNLLMQHARVRRLEGEAIRDAILTVSGRLDPKMFGPSVPVHLTEFQQGRGRPASGPIDGAGRRSVYLSVRRNFLSPLLLAFDTPIPFSTVGRRTVSNVPAQALILLNDPFVHQQADVWAKRVIAESPLIETRIDRMYLAAYGRSPTAAELSACRDYVANDDWSGLAHVLLNAKEFIFLE